MTGKPNPRIIRLVGQNKGGGARIHVWQLNSELARRGDAATTFIPAPEFDDPFTRRGMVRLDYRHETSLCAILSDARAGPVRYIHSHLRNATLNGALLATLVRVPHLITVHGPLYEGRGSRRDHVIARLFGIAMTRARLVIFISGFVRDHVLCQAGVDAGSINGIVIHNGSNDLGLPPTPTAPGPLRVVVVGELTARKGMDDLLQLAEMLSDGTAGIVIDVYGRGPYERALRERAEYGAPITLRGYEKRPAQIFHNADLHLILSRTEGFGRVITEAMSAGVPTLAYRAGAFPEIVKTGKDGILVDSLPEIADILRRIADDRDLLKVLSRGARMTYERCFTVEHFANSTLRSIKESLKG